MSGLLESAAAVLVVAVAIDVLWGELPTPVHPVVWMGRLAARLERWAPTRGAFRQLVAGALIALVVPGAFATAGVAVGWLRPWPVAWFAVSAALLTSTFAIQALGHAARGVRDALVRGNLTDARAGLRSLCSRDPRRLTEPQLVAATVESVAENTSDSVVAPLCYYALFGLPGALFYRAVNTLDARIGYHGRYEYLGKASARLDDLLNFVPARLTAALLLIAGRLAGADARAGWTMWRRDGATTESPNAGRPMATMAGLLRVRLEKPGHHRLGDPGDPLATAKIDQAWRIVWIAAAIAAGLTVLAVGGRDAWT